MRPLTRLIPFTSTTSTTFRLLRRSCSTSTTTSKFASTASVTISSDGSYLLLNTNNNKESKIHAAWLWSQCPSRIMPNSGQRLRSLGSYLGEKIVSADISKWSRSIHDHECFVPPVKATSCHPVDINNSILNKMIPDNDRLLLQVKWNDNQTSTFDVDWLQEFAYDNSSLKTRRLKYEISKSRAIHRDSALFEIGYENLIQQKDYCLLKLLQALFTDGVAIVQSVPSNINKSEKVVRDLASILSYSGLSHGAMYGDIFHVTSDPGANNIANTSVKLSPHQDLAYYESPPGFQMLHCSQYSPSIKGGESFLIDCMAAANELRNIAPFHFETLCNTQATFIKERKGAKMTYLRPHIVLQNSDIVAVNWAPNFEGPPSCKAEDFEAYTAAYFAFEMMLDKGSSSKIDSLDEHHQSYLRKNHSSDQLSAYLDYAYSFTWEKRLEPGSVLIFNNRRILHGRNAFTYSNQEISSEMDEQRHLIGGYISLDDTFLKYTQLIEEHDQLSLRLSAESSWKYYNIGNGSTCFP